MSYMQQRTSNSIYKKHVEETGKRLYDLRMDARLSQAELVAQLSSHRKKGAYVKISKNQYARYENGSYFINSEVLIALCRFYNVSSDYILFGHHKADNITEDILEGINKENALQLCKVLECIEKNLKNRFL